MPPPAAKKGVKKDDCGVKFRLHSKTVALTYSCPKNLESNPIETCEEIRDFAIAKYGHAMYTIAREEHKSGKPHFHCHLKFDTKVDTTDARCFDFQNVHPNIDKGGLAWEAYIRKDNNFITNKPTDAFSEALAMPNAAQALDHLWQKKAGDMLRTGHLIEQNMRSRMATPTSFLPYYGPYEHWPVWNHEKFSLLIWGKPGGHKTSFCRWVMAHKFGEYNFFKKNHELLRKVREWKPFLFDEVYLLEKEPALSREITDVESGGSVACRNTDAEIPSSIPRIFISNYQRPFRNPQDSVYGRRVVSMEYFHGIVQENAPVSTDNDAQTAALARYDPTGVLAGIF